MGRRTKRLRSHELDYKRQ